MQSTRILEHTVPRGSLVFLLLLVGSAAAAADEPGTAATNSKVENAVVKVFATIRGPDLGKPWTKQAPAEITGSGVVIEGRRILTNAHMVLYATQVDIQANQAGDKLSAKVVAVAPGIDLAILKLDDDSFFETHPPLPRATALPKIRDAVLAYGYPTGGASLSITKGIVSRIEYAPYNFSTAGLRIQIDAAINPGNSGGAAVAGDKMIGLAFSRAGGDTQNIGYIIPNDEIDLFLRDIADGRYDGKPALQDDLQTLENPTLRRFLKLDKSIAGVVVHRPYGSEAGYPLKEWDVITHIDATPIDDQGMVLLNGDLRVWFQYRVQQAVKNGKVPLTIVREGKSLLVQVPVTVYRPRLIPEPHGEYPSYFIYGPLVFEKVTTLFASGIASNNGVAMRLAFLDSPLVTKFGASPDANRDELVVIAAPIFPGALAKGYSNPFGAVVQSINGQPVRSLSHLVGLLRDLKDELVVFDFAGRSNESIVLARAEVLAKTEGILADNGVRAQGSDDVMAVWRQKPAN